MPSQDVKVRDLIKKKKDFDCRQDPESQKPRASGLHFMVTGHTDCASPEEDKRI